MSDDFNLIQDDNKEVSLNEEEKVKETIIKIEREEDRKDLQ
jgi:hypothetical protein